MSVDPEAPAPEAEGTPAAPATQDIPTWEDGTPFDPDRAKRTIESLRAFEADAKKFRALQEDESARDQWLIDNGYVIEDDDPPEPDEPNAPQVLTDPRIDAIEAHIGQERFEKDFTTEIGDREVNGVGRKFIEDQTVKGGNTPQSLKAAVKEWFDYVDSLAPPAPKRSAPHVPKGGQTPSGPDKRPEDMTTAEKERYIIDRLHAEAG